MTSDEKKLLKFKLRIAQLQELGETMTMALIDQDDDIIEVLAQLMNEYDDSLVRACIALAIANIGCSVYNRIAESIEEKI